MGTQRSLSLGVYWDLLFVGFISADEEAVAFKGAPIKFKIQVCCVGLFELC